MTRTADPDEYEDPAFRLSRLPETRPFYRTLSEFERQELDSRQAELMRDARMDYDPYAT